MKQGNTGPPKHLDSMKKATEGSGWERNLLGPAFEEGFNNRQSWRGWEGGQQPVRRLRLLTHTPAPIIHGYSPALLLP